MNNCIPLSQTNCTRGNKYKLDKFRAKLDLKKNFYLFRIVVVWNSLNNWFITCAIINSFVKKFKECKYGQLS